MCFLFNKYIEIYLKNNNYSAYLKKIKNGLTHWRVIPHY